MKYDFNKEVKLFMMFDILIEKRLEDFKNITLQKRMLIRSLIL